MSTKVGYSFKRDFFAIVLNDCIPFVFLHWRLPLGAFAMYTFSSCALPSQDWSDQYGVGTLSVDQSEVPNIGPVVKL